MPILGLSAFLSTVAQEPIVRSLTDEQTRFLCHLATFKTPPSVNAAGAAIGLYPVKASRCVSALVKLGLVKRIPDKDDLRITRVALTKQGRSAYEKLDQLYRR